MAFTWTKLQDFYLRLGFLKILVALLDPDRRSVNTETLIRQLKAALFEPVEERGELWRELQAKYGWFTVNLSSQSYDKRSLSLVQCLLLVGKCPSTVFAVTPKTAYKIVDWGRDIGFLGPGNQITETALILRHLIDIEAANAFISGQHLTWNPFILSPEEKIFFLFILAAQDHLTLEILSSLGSIGAGRTLETRGAEDLTCRAFFRLLGHGRTNSPLELGRLRIARELACTIAMELGIKDFDSICSENLIPRVQKVRQPMRGGLQRERQTTKNADHQTVPRFEQLTDLGFLEKPIEPGLSSEKIFAARKHWRYQTTPACHAFSNTDWSPEDAVSIWTYKAFASTAIAAGLTPYVVTSHKPNSDDIARAIWTSYEKVRRPIGHTPAFSVAALAMIRASARGIPLEMSDVHSVLLQVKVKNLAPDHAFFASGNELDRMFIVLRPGFLEQVVPNLHPEGDI
jgi:hypothetical protein